jgi:aryl-alcohol dehydrogenase-like predicted oxidoreductase
MAQDGRTNEELVGKAIAKHGREKFIIATKFGIVFGPEGAPRVERLSGERAERVPERSERARPPTSHL